MKKYKKSTDFTAMRNRMDFIKELYSVGITSFDPDVLNKLERFYRSFDIPKKNGVDVRSILSPNKELKVIQLAVKKMIDNQLNNSNFHFYNSTQAFQRGKDIFSNAQLHRNKSYIIHLDLLDFFNSIHFGRVAGVLKKIGLTEQLAYFIANICCYKKILPQGAPTSPIISNLVTINLDKKLISLSKKYHFQYSRYADDLIFSTNDVMTINNNLTNFIYSVSDIVSMEGFLVNWQKLTISGPDVRHTVTGLSNNKRVSSTRTFYSLTRALSNQLYVANSYQLNGKTYLGSDEESLKTAIQVIEGRYAFIDNIENKNASLYAGHQNGDEYHAISSADFKDRQMISKDINNVLTGKQLSYSKFIFYKLFLAGDQISVFTEGVTDVTYIKTAMKILKFRPKVILKSFQIESERSSTFSRLFDVNRGGDGLTKILNYYFNEDIGEKANKTNYQYWEYFKNKLVPIKPVVLLFDSEFDTTGKPIDGVISKYVNLIFNDSYTEKIKTDYKRKNEAFLLTQTVSQKDKILKDKIKTFKKNFKIKIIAEIKQKGFYKMKGNLYVAVTSNLQMYSSNRSIEDYFPDQFLKDIFGNQSAHFENKNVDNKQSIPLGKYRLSKYVEHSIPLRADKEKIMEGFKPLLTIFDQIQEDYIKGLADKLDKLDTTSQNKLVERLTSSKELKPLVKKYNISINDK